MLLSNTETLARPRSRVRLPIVPILVVAILVLGAAFAPWLAPYSPLKIDLAHSLRPPFFQSGGSLSHPLGTDKLGRDVLSRVMYGGRVSLGLSIAVMLIGGTLGTLLGILSGYHRGLLDAITQRCVEAILSMPMIMAALVFVFVVGPSVVAVIAILSPFVAASFTRMTRGETLSIRQKDFVLLAQVAGCSTSRIVLRHILPNIAGTIIVLATIQIGALILLESSLSFLGIGVPPPTPSWGQMIADGRQFLTSKYWLSTMPGGAILLLVLSINWIGDWLRDLLDPKVRVE
jgi:peptide/nickel transport system permease protein